MLISKKTSTNFFCNKTFKYPGDIKMGKMATCEVKVNTEENNKKKQK